MSTTYGESRTPKQVEVDADLMAYVKRGMELLERKYGPDWVEHIDLLKLDLGDAEVCVLGQLYEDAVPTPEQWAKYTERNRYADPLSAATDGFSKAVAIIDGDLLEPGGTSDHGFDDLEDAGYSFDDLTDAWVEAIKQERVARYTVD